MNLQELKIVKCYRAFSTSLQLCLDRGYRISKPAMAVDLNNIYSAEGDDGDHPAAAAPVVDFETFKKNAVSMQDLNSDAAATPATTTGGRGGKKGGAGAGASSNIVQFLNREALVISAKWRGEETPAAEAGGDEAAAATSTSPSRKLLIFFVEESTLSMNTIAEYRSRAQQKKCSSIVLVIAGKINPAVRRDTEELSCRTGEGAVRIQLFEEEDLMGNVTRHETTPKHFPLSVEQGRELLVSKGLQLSQLPRILATDPIVAYYGLERGRILRIVRSCEHAGEYDMYRQVI